MKTTIDKLDEKFYALAPEETEDMQEVASADALNESSEGTLNPTQVLQEMTIGIAAFAVVVQVIGIFVSKDLLHYSIGLWIGAVTAVFLAVNIRKTIESVLDQAGTGGFHGRYALIRYAAVFILFIVLFVFKIGNLITCFIGIMGLKIGAYMQPFIHKLLRR